VKNTEDHCQSVIHQSHIKGLRLHVNISQDAGFAYGNKLLMASPPLKLKISNSDEIFDYICDLSNKCYLLCSGNVSDLITIIMLVESTHYEVSNYVIFYILLLHHMF
jgi:hypothetical protein